MLGLEKHTIRRSMGKFMSHELDDSVVLLFLLRPFCLGFFCPSLFLSGLPAV